MPGQASARWITRCGRLMRSIIGVPGRRREAVPRCGRRALPAAGSVQAASEPADRADGSLAFEVDLEEAGAAVGAAEEPVGHRLAPAQTPGRGGSTHGRGVKCSRKHGCSKFLLAIRRERDGLRERSRCIARSRARWRFGAMLGPDGDPGSSSVRSRTRVESLTGDPSFRIQLTHQGWAPGAFLSITRGVRAAPGVLRSRNRGFIRARLRLCHTLVRFVDACSPTGPDGPMTRATT